MIEIIDKKIICNEIHVKYIFNNKEYLFRSSGIPLEFITETLILKNHNNQCE